MRKEQFDIIFFDPPFPYRFHEDLINIVSKNNLLKENGLAIIHRPAEKQMKDNIGNLTKKDFRIYGRSIVDFYCKKENS